MYDKIKKTASPLYLTMNGCSDMLNVVKTKCYKVISDTFKGEDILLDVVRDMGDTDDDITRYWRDEDASMADLLSWVCTSDEAFIKLINFVINPPVVSGEKQATIISNLKGLLLDCGYDLIETNKVNGKTRYKLVEYVAEKMLSESTDFTSFDELFPFGLPVSINKPNFTLNSVKGRQKPGFVENDNVGILRGDVYPRFDVMDFVNWCNPEERLGAYIKPQFVVDDICTIPWTVGYNLCTTPSEKLFYQDYLSAFVIPFIKWTSEKSFLLDNIIDIVPALVPQVWVRFESHSANERNRMGYKDERLPYRVDFVAFWNNRRFIIMIDGIEHYGKQVRGGWDAE